MEIQQNKYHKLRTYKQFKPRHSATPYVLKLLIRCVYLSTRSGCGKRKSLGRLSALVELPAKTMRKYKLSTYISRMLLTLAKIVVFHFLIKVRTALLKDKDDKSVQCAQGRLQLLIIIGRQVIFINLTCVHQSLKFTNIDQILTLKNFIHPAQYRFTSHQQVNLNALNIKGSA